MNRIDFIADHQQITNQTLNDLESELNEFRMQWKMELMSKENDKNVSDLNGHLQIHNGNSNDDKFERNAIYLFNKAVILEQQGRLYEAVKYYRMAMQLDADIEYKIATKTRLANPQKQRNDDNIDELNSENIAINVSNEYSDLYEYFNMLNLNDDTQPKLCEKNINTKATHFSDLPIEVVMYIIRWIISDELDMRSLESFSMVCKGFYLCARDPQIWRIACEKIWPNTAYTPNILSSYCSSWRQMFIKRPRVNLDGVYISKATYTRAGEQSLDNFYRPWHLVEYYRFLRFFSDGTVLMLTTPEEPKACTSKFKFKNPKDLSIIKGNWTLDSNRISILMQKKIVKYGTGRQRRGVQQMIANQELFYNLEFELNSIGKRYNIQLTWIHYDLHIINKLTNTESQTAFDINRNDFPPFYYSRVKSYTNTSENILK